MSIKNYGSGAIIAAIVVIAVALVATPLLLTNNTVSASTSFAVMLTDPPNVPSGTTSLNMTYSSISLYVLCANGTHAWITSDESGTVDLLQLVNVSQTLAVTNVPVNSTVEKVQFVISDVQATINGETYNVTSVSDTITLSVKCNVDQTSSGVLIDFTPTLLEIQATDDGEVVTYYVFVPSANVKVMNNLDRDHCTVGWRHDLNETERGWLRALEESANASRNLEITSATLTVNSTSKVTSLSLTVTNNGNSTAHIFGLTLHGLFKSGTSWSSSFIVDQFNWNLNLNLNNQYSRTIPFKVNATSSTVTPVFGSQADYAQQYNGNNHNEALDSSDRVVVLEAGKSITLTYSGIIALSGSVTVNSGSFYQNQFATIFTPVVGQNYTIGLMGAGYATATVTATAA